MTKQLVIDYEKCTGCRLCEMVCSVKHEGVNNPLRSRINIAKWETKGLMVPMVCRQCEDAPCVSVCPTNARLRDEELGRVIVNYDRCIGCKTCVVACPFGAINWDPLAKKVISCDLCDGEALCAKFCETGAIRFVEVSSLNKEHQRGAAEKLVEAMQKVAEPAVR
ncbi:MAG TPA: 4Fe-4S dicluster domain-containing protein [Dehalococcoidales bacterium]|nr:4Fe-4S dicluster domain-containing protein [Dehalococcoidales bacterium]